MDSDKYSKDSLDFLIRLTHTNPDPNNLSYALEEIGRREEIERTLPVLFRAVSHKKPIVREGAIYGMGHLFTNIYNYLVAISQVDQDDKVRQAAKEVLQHLK